MKMRICLILLLSLIVQRIYPQKIKFEHIRNEDGLSQNNITCIAQDELGLMWIGTEDGINQYNGYEFKIYKNIEEDPNSISGNYIESILLDKQNRLWCGTNGGGLSLYNREFDNWENFRTENDLIPSNSIADIVSADDRTLYVSTYNAGVFKFCTETKTSEKLILKPIPFCPISSVFFPFYLKNQEIFGWVL
jgi:hypothetical protein